jgi:hypothetical protein
MSMRFPFVALQGNGMPLKSIYVYGKRNSGTNYVNALIQKNCRAPGGTSLYDAKNKGLLGWKHGFPSVQNAPDTVLAIAVYRDPIAWLHSMCRTPWHAAAHLHGLPFSQFIRSEWMAIIDDEGFGITPDHPLWHHELLSERDPVTGARFANPMRLRNAKHHGFARLHTQFANVLRVRYESVLANPNGFLTAVCQQYGLLRQPTFDPILYDRATPVRGLYAAKPVPSITDADMEFICTELDMQAEAALGYHLLPPVQTMVA